MFNPVRAVIDRIKAFLATAAAVKIEVDALPQHAEEKGGLLQLAAQLEAESLQDAAQEIRQQADALDGKQPVATVTLSLSSWQCSNRHLDLRRHSVLSSGEPS
jgi:hypothetical protein